MRFKVIMDREFLMVKLRKYKHVKYYAKTTYFLVFYINNIILNTKKNNSIVLCRVCPVDKKNQKLDSYNAK